MSNYIPDYTTGSIPTGDDIFDDMPDVFGQSGQDIASWFGFEEADQYSEFFNPVNVAGIQEGMSKIPDTRNFLFGQNRDWYTNQKTGILNKLGRTGLAGSNQQSSLLGSLNREYGSKMFSSERQVQDLVQGYQDQLSREISNLYGSAGTVLQSGAKMKGINYKDSGTVLCTELNRQGIMSDELYQADIKFSESLSEATKRGYRLWANPIANKMKTSKILTAFMKPFIMSWARHMAGKKNVFGTIAMAIGVPLCNAINKVSRFIGTKKLHRRKQWQNKVL